MSSYAKAGRNSLRFPRPKAARVLFALIAVASAVLIVSDLAVTHARAPSTVVAKSAPSMATTPPVSESKLTVTGSSSEPTSFHPLTDF
jgi:hypothetical protein